MSDPSSSPTNRSKGSEEHLFLVTKLSGQGQCPELHARITNEQELAWLEFARREREAGRPMPIPSHIGLVAVGQELAPESRSGLSVGAGETAIILPAGMLIGWNIVSVK